MRHKTIISMAAGVNPWYESGIKESLGFGIYSLCFYSINSCCFPLTTFTTFQTNTCSIRLKPSEGLTSSHSIL
jgi:hypothetical protein